MFIRPVSRHLARELQPLEIDQVSGADDMAEEPGHGTATGELTFHSDGTKSDEIFIRD